MMHKMVNGEKIPLNQQEIDEITAEWESNRIKINKDEEKRKILEQLIKIDLKTIRSLREGDLARVAAFEAEAIQVRALLNGVQ